MASTPILVDRLLIDDIDFEDSVKITFPEIKWKEATLTGCGIGGDVTIPLVGNSEAMSATVDMRSFNNKNSVLLEPGPHILESRFNRNVTTNDGTVFKAGSKVFMTVLNTSVNPGSVQRANELGASATFSVLRYRYIEDGQELFLIDPLNGILKVNRKNYSNDI